MGGSGCNGQYVDHSHLKPGNSEIQCAHASISCFENRKFVKRGVMVIYTVSYFTLIYGKNNR